jgi:hypothetical protein
LENLQQIDSLLEEDIEMSNCWIEDINELLDRGGTYWKKISQKMDEKYLMSENLGPVDP